jgi:hypothetical protein
MAITININGLTLCHKGSDGVSHNTLPDVCKTPDKGVPTPYQNEAYSKDLIKGTTTCFADGGNMIANLGSQFAVSIYDESGSMGGVVSGTNKAEADWISHSFDVFFEGKPACRLTDKMFMNHHNTVNLSGEWQKHLKPPLVEKICNAICECRKKIMPSMTEITEAAGDIIDTVRGIDNTSAEKASNLNEVHRRQECFNKHFIKDGDNPWHGARPEDPKVLSEVPYYENGDLIRSQSTPPRTTYPGGPTAPGSIKRSLNVAKNNPMTVRWDMVVVKDQAKPAEWENVHKVLEIKFEGDDWTKNQKNALRNPEIDAKVERVDEDDCGCDVEEERESARTAEKYSESIENSGELLRKMLPFFGPPGSPIKVPL